MGVQQHLRRAPIGRLPIAPAAPPRLMDAPESAPVVERLRRMGVGDQEIERTLQEFAGRGTPAPMAAPGLGPTPGGVPPTSPAMPTPEAPPARGAGPTAPSFGAQRASDLAGPPDRGLPPVRPGPDGSMSVAPQPGSYPGRLGPDLSAMSGPGMQAFSDMVSGGDPMMGGASAGSGVRESDREKLEAAGLRPEDVETILAGADAAKAQRATTGAGGPRGDQHPPGRQPLDQEPIIRALTDLFGGGQAGPTPAGPPPVPQGRTPEQLFGPQSRMPPTAPAPPAAAPVPPRPPVPPGAMAPAPGDRGARVPVPAAVGAPAAGPRGTQMVGGGDAYSQIAQAVGNGDAYSQIARAFSAGPTVGPYGEPMRPTDRIPAADQGGNFLGVSGDTWDSLLQFGLATMAAGGEPNANLLGSLGRGGLAAMQGASARGASRHEQRMDRQQAATDERRARAAERNVEIAAAKAAKDPVVKYDAVKGGEIMGFTEAGKKIATGVTVNSLSKGDMLDAAIKMSEVSITDPTTLQTNKGIDPARFTAALEFLNAYQSGGGAGTATPGTSGEGQPVKLSTDPQKADAEYAKLKSGAPFIGPDGITRRKP